MTNYGTYGFVDEVMKLPTTTAFASGAAFTFTDIPTDKDIVAYLLQVKGQASTGAATPVKIADNPFGILSELNLRGDGNEIMSLFDTELLWLHWLFWGRSPIRQETHVAINGAAKDFMFQLLIPFGYKRALSPYKQLVIDGKWGTGAAGLDSSANFAITTNPVITYTLLRGTAYRSFYTKRHTIQALNGTTQKTIPKGRLVSIILQIADQTQNLDVIKLKNGGRTIKDFDYFTSLSEVRQLYNIDFGYYGSSEGAAGTGEADFERFRRGGITMLDVMGEVSDGVNASLEIKTLAAKDVDILYLYEGTPI